MPAWLASACFATWMGLLTAVHYTSPSWQAYTLAGLGLSGAAAVGIGLLLHRPGRSTPWLLLVGALLIMAGTESVYRHAAGPAGYSVHLPAPPVDSAYLLMYPLLGGGLLLFARSLSSNRDYGGLLDALMLTAGLGGAAMLLMEGPDAGRALLLTASQKAVGLAYPVVDLLCLVVLFRLATLAPRPRPAAQQLGVGVGVMLVADLAYGALTLQAGWHLGGLNDLAWAGCFAAVGAAALHPSMTALTMPVRDASGQLSAGRLGVLAVASLLAPGVLLTEHVAFGAVRNAPAIAILSGVMFLLVLLRLRGVVASHRQAVARERALRQASAALVSAADVEQVGAAVRTALGSLLPAGVPHTVVLAETAPPAGGATGDAARVELTATGDLAPEVAEQLDGHPTALRCHLHPHHRDGDDRFAGAFYVGAPAWALHLLTDALEVLSSQAALALDRIVLTREVHRRDSEAYFRTLVLNTSDVILIVGADDLIRYASPSAGTVLGTDALAAVPVADVMQPSDRVRLAHVLAQARAGLARHDGLDFRVVGPDGQPVAVELSCHDLRDDRTVAGLVLTLRDVTERRKLEHELTHQAFHDSLTGLANRVLFADRVDHAVTRSQRERSVLGVLVVDLDDFKVVNETLGHGAGDQLLVAVAERLTGALRPHDTAARLGGDEFAALIEDVRHPGDVEQIAERVLAALAEPFVVDGETVQGVASIGITTSAEADTGEEMLRQADLALYVAKGGGKNQWRRYQADLHTAMVERLELRAALDHAVNEGQFLLQYQPIVDLVAGHAVGFEALVRWHHPTRGVVAPAHFIEVAEETGLIVPIGRWVLDEALATAAGWNRTLPAGRSVYVSVNVSVRQFRSAGFVDMVRQSLAAAGVRPEVLMLEITESLLLRDDEQVWVDLASLRELGVRIAIDDFGTGYSSLSYLRHMPIDVLKIDKSFIDDMVTSKQQLALVSAIVRLAETLNLQVVAEGVEEPSHRDTLAALGCPYGQGYFYSRPVGAAEAAGWLAPRAVAAA